MHWWGQLQLPKHQDVEPHRQQQENLESGVNDTQEPTEKAKILISCRARS